MTTGLQIPITANEVGGAQLSSRNSQLAKVIALAFSSGENDNPFQLADGDVGFSPPVFGLNDVAAMGRVRRRAIQVMEILELQERAKLISDGIRVFNSAQQNPDLPDDLKVEPGEIGLEIKYINLETQNPQTFRRRFTE